MKHAAAKGAGHYVVVFHARVRRLNADYSAMAARMRELALEQLGCLEFHAVTEGEP